MDLSSSSIDNFDFTNGFKIIYHLGHRMGRHYNGIRLGRLILPSVHTMQWLMSDIEQTVNLAGTIIITISINSIIHTTDDTATTAFEHLGATAKNALRLPIIAAAIVPNALWLRTISATLLLGRLLQPRPWIKVMLMAPSIVGFAAGGIGIAIVTILRCDPVAGQ